MHVKACVTLSDLFQINNNIYAYINYSNTIIRSVRVEKVNFLTLKGYYKDI